MLRLGDRNALPAAAIPAVIDMREGGIRRILIPPDYGWVNNAVGPIPDTFGGRRRLAAHRDEPLLLEVELKKVFAPEANEEGVSAPVRLL